MSDLTKRIETAPALFLAAACLLLAPVGFVEGSEAGPAAAASPTTAEEDAATRVIVLSHLDTKSATTLARSIYQLRQIAEYRPTRTLIIRGERETVDATAELLRKVDVPAPRWTAELLLATEDGELVLRRLDVGSDPAQVRYGGSGSPRLEVDLHAWPVGSSLHAEYRISADLRFADERAEFKFGETADATLDDGDQLALLEPSLPELRRSLADLVGLEGEANALFLRFRSAN